MNIYFMIAIAIANILAITIVYQFIKKLENKEKVIFIAISIAIMYILVSIIYWISGFGINKTIHEQARDFITYLFVPVNVILFIPYIAYQYVDLKEKHIKQAKFLKKVTKTSVLLIIALIVEFFYFRNIQNNITTIGNNANNIANETQENVERNEITNEIQENIEKNEKTKKK